MPKFINPSTVVAQMGLHSGQTVADLGSGSGFYALAVAKIVGSSGLVYAVDVQEARLTAMQSSARQHGMKNISTLKADLDRPLVDIGQGTCDAVILASILHEVESQDMLIKNAYSVLKTGGRILAVDWKKQYTPFGPPLEKRLTEAELEQFMTKAGLRKEKDIPADSYHFAMVFVK